MVAEASPTIWVIAGPNGAGKSSIIGETIRESGADYFNPDELTQRLVDRNPGLLRERANALGWERGKKGLERAVSDRQNFALETTLGGRTITKLLLTAAERGIALRIWYVALDTADRHVARVKARVARGGHDVSERQIRSRYDESRANVCRLFFRAEAVRLYDNSYEADVLRGERPRPRLLLDYAGGCIKNRKNLSSTPDWAKPIVAAALKAER